MPTWGGYWGDPWGIGDLTESEIMATTPYLTKEEAQAGCFDEMLGTEAWDNASDADKDKSLKQATRMINQLSFIGKKSDPDQDNEFPRDVSDGEVPDSVKRATCSVALALLKGLTLEALEEKAGIASESVGDASVSYGTTRGRQELLDDNLGLPSSAAARELREWVTDPRRVELDRV